MGVQVEPEYAMESFELNEQEPRQIHHTHQQFRFALLLMKEADSSPLCG